MKHEDLAVSLLERGKPAAQNIDGLVNDDFLLRVIRRQQFGIGRWYRGFDASSLSPTMTIDQQVTRSGEQIGPFSPFCSPSRSGLGQSKIDLLRRVAGVFVGRQSTTQELEQRVPVLREQPFEKLGITGESFVGRYPHAVHGRVCHEFLRDKLLPFVGDPDHAHAETFGSVQDA